MTDQEDDKATAQEWKKRMNNVRMESGEINAFVEDRLHEGSISEATKHACTHAYVEVLRKAGLLEPSMRMIESQCDFADPELLDYLENAPPSVRINDAILCAVITQAMHEERRVLLEAHPELAERLFKEVPSTNGGRIALDLSGATESLRKRQSRYEEEECVFVQERVKRLKSVKMEHAALVKFVEDRRDDGSITEQDFRAWTDASVERLRKANLKIQIDFEGQLSPDDLKSDPHTGRLKVAILCTEVGLAVYEERSAFCLAHPELAKRLNREVKNTEGGRIAWGSSHDGYAR